VLYAHTHTHSHCCYAAAIATCMCALFYVDAESRDKWAANDKEYRFMAHAYHAKLTTAAQSKYCVIILHCVVYAELSAVSVHHGLASVSALLQHSSSV
jgi:hypothetical protein